MEHAAARRAGVHSPSDRHPASIRPPGVPKRLAHPTRPCHHPPTHPQGKTNFFERRVGEYQRAGVMQSVSNLGAARKYEHTFSLDEDF